MHAKGYATVQRLLHWITVLFVLAMIPAGIAMTHKAFAPVQDLLFVVHKNGGVILGLLLVARLGWRLTHRPDPLPASMPLVQRRVAALIHGLLYVLLLTMVTSGYLRVVGGGFPIELLNALGIPPLVPNLGAAATISSAVHKFASYALVAVVMVHVTAALQHALVARDGVMQRIWPPVGRAT